ncbi:MAG: hypothetical protein PVH22_15360, partial [Desulfobacteraceae bacterium]
FAALIAGNVHIRFLVENSFRKLIGKPIVSIRLVTIKKHCKDGQFLTHCLELTNMMWFCPVIPNIYLISQGQIPYESQAYVPSFHFKSHGMNHFEKRDTKSALKDISEKIIPRTPGNSSLGFNLRRGLPIRVVLLCERIHQNQHKDINSLNEQHILGDLYIAVTNPMYKTALGVIWFTSIVSEDLGYIDGFKIEIPKELAGLKALGSSADIHKKPVRHPCLSDVGVLGLTWPLRFVIDDLRILIKGGVKARIEIINPCGNGRAKIINRFADTLKNVFLKKKEKPAVRATYSGIKVK